MLVSSCLPNTWLLLPLSLAPVVRRHLHCPCKLTYRPPEIQLSVDMSESPYQDNHSTQAPELELWEQDSQYAPTPGFFRSPFAARSTYSPSPSIHEDEPRAIRQARQNAIPLLQLSDWNKDTNWWIRISSEHVATLASIFLEPLLLLHM